VFNCIENVKKLLLFRTKLSFTMLNTLSHKKIPDTVSCNRSWRCGIFMILVEMFHRKKAAKTWYNLSRHLISVSALPCRIGNMDHLHHCTVCCFANKKKQNTTILLLYVIRKSNEINRGQKASCHLICTPSPSSFTICPIRYLAPCHLIIYCGHFGHFITRTLSEKKLHLCRSTILKFS